MAFRFKKRENLQKVRFSIKNNPEVDEITEFYNKIVKSELFANPTPEEAVKNVELIEKIIKAK